MRKGLSIEFLVASLVFIIILIAYLVIFHTPKKTTDLTTIGRAFELACERGNYSINISLGGKKSFVLSKNINEISLYGDPKEILYYEFFPPISDIPWMYWIRDEMPLVVYSFITEEHVNDIDAYRKYLKAEARRIFGGKDVRVVFINMEPGKGIVPSNREDSFFSKHVFCGDNSLCLKSRDRIQRYELRECKKKGINYVAIDYPYFFRIPSIVILKAVDDLTLKGIVTRISSILGAETDAVSIFNSVSSFLGISDWTHAPYPFYLSSPCYNERIVIDAGECDCRKIEFPVFDRSGKKIGESYWCDTFKLFGDRPVEKTKCLKVSIEPDYSRSYCYNNDMTNQIYYSGNRVVSALFKVFFGIPMSSIRGECIVKIDEYSIVFDPSCTENIRIGMEMDEGLLRSISKMGIKILLARTERSSFMSAWPVDVFLVGE